jgi:hypothetical protein
MGAFGWAASAPSARRSLATICACLFFWYAALEVFWDQCIHRPKYAADLAMMKDSLKAVPEGERLLLVGDCFGPLGGSLWLHYLEGRAEYLHNLTFLKAARRNDSAVYVIARPFDEPVMAHYGTFERRLQSAYSPRERSPDDRWTLYHFRFHDDLRRVEAPPIDAMQATGRAPGPFVE